MSDAPKEMCLEMKWHDQHRVHITLVNGDRTLHSDYCDPRSQRSRNNAIDTLLGKFPALDRDTIEGELLQLARRGPPRDEAKALSAVEPDPEPWPDPVDGALLLDEIAAFLRRFVILPAHAAEACALWVLHTFVYSCFEYTPRLLIHSPEKRCGKSRLLRILHSLSRRPLSCESISAPALFRSIETYQPTLCLDEADNYLSGRYVNEDLRGVLNAGHQRGGRVIRCVGDNAEPTAFSCFGPVAIAMIGKPPGTLEDRSIPIAMRRKLPGERVERFAPGQSLRAQFIECVQRCVRWANDNRDALFREQPDVPSSLDDRAADCWFALFAIADRAGGRWPDMARTVAVALMGARDGADSLGVQLLQDAKLIFDSNAADRMSTAGLIAELVLLEERLWPEIRNGRPITPTMLARLLRPFGISSKTIRLPDDSTPKGYFRKDFEEPWSRYLRQDPAAPPAGAATAPLPSGDNDLRPSGGATADPSVAPPNARNPLSDQACGGVAPPARGAPSKDPPGPMEQLCDLVADMAADIDAAPPGTVPFDGAALRDYYRAAVRLHGVEAALADAQARRALQVEGTFLPLQKEAS